MNTSTPVRSEAQKRELSSPLEETEKKKQLLSISAHSDIADPVTIDPTESPDGNPPVTDTATKVPDLRHMALSVADCQVIADALKSSFQADIVNIVKGCIEEIKPKDVISPDHIQTIVTGVVQGLETKICDIEKQNKALTSENERLTKRLEAVEAKCDALEQYGRRNCLRVVGVPEGPSATSTDEYIVKLCADIGVPVGVKDIDRSHRIGKPGNPKPRAIIVKFVSYRARNLVFKSRSKLKNCGYKDIFINEDLTKSRSALLYKARILTKNGKIQGAWSSDGSILIKDHQGAIKQIQTYSDLSRFG
jgi:exosome complex exonuclease DIS3/RRP44